MEKPLISVIVAVYNGAGSLQCCIDSVQDQTYPNKEIIIMDGGSTDGTVEILEGNSGRIAYWESGPDTGIYNAWNKALSHARGEYICFLGSDDYFWEDDVLEKMSAAFPEAGRRGVNIIYGKCAVIDEKGEVHRVLGKPWEKIKSLFLQEMCIDHPAILHHRNIFERHGGFDESMKISGDYELLLRELKSNDALFVPVLAIGWRHGGVSSLESSLERCLMESRQAKIQNGLPTGVYHWGWLPRSMIKLYLQKRLGGRVVRMLRKTYVVLTTGKLPIA